MMRDTHEYNIGRYVSNLGEYRDYYRYLQSYFKEGVIGDNNGYYKGSY